MLNATKEEKEQLTEHHNVDLVALATSLDKISERRDQIAHLQQLYPYHAVFVMKKAGMWKELDQYTERCRGYENDHENYSLYVHVYLPMYFQSLRDAGKLKKGK